MLRTIVSYLYSIIATERLMIYVLNYFQTCKILREPDDKRIFNESFKSIVKMRMFVKFKKLL